MDWVAAWNHLKHTWWTTFLSMILFTGVTYFLWWAECKSIQNNLMLEELVSNAETVKLNKVDDTSLYDGRLVHIVGPLSILEPISEPDYNIQVQAVKLRRRVQMYQWIEDTNGQVAAPSGNSDVPMTYWYRKEWKDYVVDTSLFYIRAGHHNPNIMPLSSETHIAENVMIGWFYLGLDVKRKVNDYYEIWSDTRPERSDIKLHSGFYYHGESALHHEVGDLRIHFTYAGRQDDIYTVVGVVNGKTVEAYSLENYPEAEPYCLLRKGSFSLSEMHQLERRVTNVHTWKYRIVGFIQVFASAMTLHPEWVTMFLECQWISNHLRRCTRVWVNLVLSFSYTFIVISVPWLMQVPSNGAMLLLGALLPLLHYSTLRPRRAARPPAPPYRPRAANPH